MKEIRQLIEMNELVSLQDVTPPEVTVEGDASDHYAAYMIYQGETVLDGKIHPTVPGQHIFLSELETAVEGCLHAYDIGFRGVNYRGDNMASLMALNRKLSTNFSANRTLSRLPCDLSIETTYVPTDKILADPFTRGEVFPPLPAPLNKIKQQHERFRSSVSPTTNPVSSTRKKT
jgi:hypothetical protein